MVEKIKPLWFYRIVRIVFAALFFWVAYAYEDGCSAYLFATIFLTTAFLKPRGCAAANCNINDDADK